MEDNNLNHANENEKVDEKRVENAAIPHELPLRSVKTGGLNMSQKEIEDIRLRIMQTEGIEELTKQFKETNKILVRYYHTIGGILMEIQAKLKKCGGWMVWLETETDLTLKQAERFMLLAREYTDSSKVTELGYSKALMLAQLPEEERNNFMGEKYNINGTEKYVSSMTVAELSPLVKAKKLELFPTTEKEAANMENQERSIYDSPKISAKTKKAVYSHFSPVIEDLYDCLSGLLNELEDNNRTKELFANTITQLWKKSDNVREVLQKYHVD